VQPVSSTRDLGVYIDADRSTRTHVTAVVRACFAALRQIRSMWRSLSRHALLTLIRALIVSKVDYCNSVLAGIPGQLQDQLQSVLNAATLLVFSARRSERITPLLRAIHQTFNTVMNAAARLVCSARKYEHITPLLRDLHWLRVPERIEFKLSVLVFRYLHGMALPYLASELRCVADVDTRKRLRYSSTSALVTPSSCRTTIGDRTFFVVAPRA